MPTRDIIESYFEELKRSGNWQRFLADDLTFTSFTSPVKR